MAETTLTNYRVRLAATLGLDNSASGDQTLIDAWVNEGYEDLVRRTRCKTAWATIDLTSGTHTYTLPTASMGIHEAYNTSGGSDYPLEQVTLQELIRARANSSSAGYPARMYAVEGDAITLYPTPGAGETITVYYTPRPAAMSSGSDTPASVPAEFHQAIEYYAAARLAEMDGHEPSGFGAYFRALYEQQVRELRRHVAGGFGRRPARAVAGRRGARTIPSDPSQTVRY